MAANARYDISVVKLAAAGRWVELLVTLGGIDGDLLDGRHHPCPKCGGTDRFRAFDDVAETGGLICNQCFSGSNGDGLAALGWLTGEPFANVIAAVAEHLNVQPESNRARSATAAGPADKLEFLDWHEPLAALWCLAKPPITPAAILAAGGRLARYREQYTVVALPAWRLDPSRGNERETCGYVLYNVTGGSLPQYHRNAKTGKSSESWVKVKLSHGSRPGLIGDYDRLAAATEAWKVEGPSDLLAALSLPDRPSGCEPYTNANGAGEHCPDWVAALLADKSHRTVHDADKPGQAGAIGTHDERRNVFRPGWANIVAATAADSRNVTLPFPVEASHGKDLRDYIGDGHGWPDLRQLADASAPIVPPAVPTAIQADDDPHRLAKVNLESFAVANGGAASLRSWRGEWYKWQGDRYARIDEKELRARIAGALKTEFDRLNVEKLRTGDYKGDEPPTSQKVTTHIVGSVVQATASMVMLSSAVEPNTWIGGGVRERRNYIAMANGILDVDAALADREDCLLPHSPDWFSTVCLPYDFDPEARCPIWEAFLEKNLELDPERIKLVQEWAGYLLLPDTGLQKMVMLEGQGSNGKSVYIAGLIGMLGTANVSSVPLEMFGDRFARTQTLGKLANFSTDAADLDRVAEGLLKAFSSGDTVFFDRKGLPGLDCVPTARIVIACNTRPRFSDRSNGIWRRIMLVPWDVEILDHEKIENMDKSWWWADKGELPGIFNWALMGLIRLRGQRRFTATEKGAEALSDYRRESNPALMFLDEHIEETHGRHTRTQLIYDAYVFWIGVHGNKPLSERQFSKEMVRRFKNCKRVRCGPRNRRFWAYDGISFSQDEIAGRHLSTFNFSENETDLF